MTGSRLLIAPACFKGSLSAPDAAQIIQAFLADHLGPEVELDICPIADGGDDTLSVLRVIDPGFQLHEAQVTGPVPGMGVRAEYLFHPQKRIAVVEAAQAHGLKLLPSGQLSPMAATSYGVGELLRDAIETTQAETLILTVGGSASTDAGMGALQALGVQFCNQAGQSVTEPIGGQTLLGIEQIDWPPSWTYPGRLLIATDVINPLLGPDGAAAVFAPQKGATPEQCALLENGLSHIAQLMEKTTGMEYATLPGAGAAGGLAYGLRHLPRSGIISGSQWIADQLDLKRKIAAADLIITAEGRFDVTSLGGKATGNVLAWAETKPVLFFCGQLQEGFEGFKTVTFFPLARTEQETAESMADPKAALLQQLKAALPKLQAHLSSLA